MIVKLQFESNSQQSTLNNSFDLSSGNYLTKSKEESTCCDQNKSQVSAADRLVKNTQDYGKYTKNL